MDGLTDIIQPLMMYVGVTFLATEVIKQLLRRVFLVDPERWSILFAVLVGIGLSYGWTLSVLPKPSRPGFDLLSAVLTGIIIAGGASGVYSWLKSLVPWYKAFNDSGKARAANNGNNN